MKEKILQFNQAIGASVPGGPFRLGETRRVKAETYEHQLIKILIGKGVIVVLADESAKAIESPQRHPTQTSKSKPTTGNAHSKAEQSDAEE